MPAPPWDYHEHEAATAWGYNLSEWAQETPHNRAKAVAHCLHKNLREAYSAEKSGEKTGKKTDGQDYASLMRSMGLS